MGGWVEKDSYQVESPSDFLLVELAFELNRDIEAVVLEERGSDAHAVLCGRVGGWMEDFPGRPGKRRRSWAGTYPWAAKQHGSCSGRPPTHQP